MNKWKNLLIAISSNRIWFITFMCLDLFFIFLAWLAYPEYFTSYVALIIFVSLAALTIPITISIKKSNKADVVFHSFLLEPDDTNEYLLCEIVPALLRPYVRELGQHLRTQQEYVNEQKIKISDYEQYIENWAHEIKKPLSLMTLLLDNRKNEMSPLVHTRMLYVRDHARQDVEQILYFSRLGAVHKDYYFEPLSILRTCREAVEDNVTLLEEAGFSFEFLGRADDPFPRKRKISNYKCCRMYILLLRAFDKKNLLPFFNSQSMKLHKVKKSSYLLTIME